MQLNQLVSTKTSSSKKRVGRGIGSGKGKTSGRGHKGQKSRAGATINGFEGGQMPIYRRLPKRGFVNIFRKDYQIVTTGQLQEFVEKGKLDKKKTVNKNSLVEASLIKDNGVPTKLLVRGELKEGLKIEVDKASRGAIEAVKKAGGEVKVTNSDTSGKSDKAA